MAAKDSGTKRNVKSRSDLHDYYNGNHAYDNDRVALSKRRESIKPKLPGGVLDLPPVAYPSSGELYTGARQNNQKEVYDFSKNKVGTTTVVDFKALKKPSDEYATEHIVEVGFIIQIPSLSSNVASYKLSACLW